MNVLTVVLTVFSELMPPGVLNSKHLTVTVSAWHSLLSSKAPNVLKTNGVALLEIKHFYLDYFKHMALVLIFLYA